MLWWDPQIPPSMFSSPVQAAELKRILMEMMHRLEVTVTAPLDLTNDSSGQHIRVNQDATSTPAAMKCEDVAKCLCVVKDLNGNITDIKYTDSQGQQHTIPLCDIVPPADKKCANLKAICPTVPTFLNFSVTGVGGFGTCLLWNGVWTIAFGIPPAFGGSDTNCGWFGYAWALSGIPSQWFILNIQGTNFVLTVYEGGNPIVTYTFPAAGWNCTGANIMLKATDASGCFGWPTSLIVLPA